MSAVVQSTLPGIDVAAAKLDAQVVALEHAGASAGQARQELVLLDGIRHAPERMEDHLLHLVGEDGRLRRRPCRRSRARLWTTWPALTTRIVYSGMFTHTWKSPRSSGIQRHCSMLTSSLRTLTPSCAPASRFFADLPPRSVVLGLCRGRGAPQRQVVLAQPLELRMLRMQRAQVGLGCLRAWPRLRSRAAGSSELRLAIESCG